MAGFRSVVVWMMLGCSVAPVGSVAAEDGVQRNQPVVVQAAELPHPVLWHDPGQIPALDLLHGAGGAEGKPEPPFTFEQEDRSVKTPRFDARDATGRRWGVELGRDARPEVAASRLLWAMGYLADEDYVVWRANVSGLRLRSGRRYLHREPRRRKGSRRPSETEFVGDYIQDARFARKVDGQRKLGVWRWRRNAFSDTREMNGLRVMMALLNCWDLKDENNAVIEDQKSGTEMFRVSGIAGSFGKTGPRMFRRASTASAKAYARSRFITRKTDAYVDFATPSAGYNPFALFRRGGGATWVGRRVPRQDARWIGGLLGQLSHKQIEDAFWAAGYSADEVNLYAEVVDARIRALGDL